MTGPAEHADDVELARRCLRGDADALAALDRRIAAAAAAAARSLNESPSFADELAQQLRDRLLVAPSAEATPRLAAFAGAGPLDGWLRVAATRTAINLRGRSAREAPVTDSAIRQLPLSAPDLDAELLKREYGAEFSRAFAEALGRLDERQRNLIRMHYLDGVGVEALGVIYRVHASTISRWLARAREQLFDDTREIVRQRLAVSEEELRELMDLVRSRMDVSISRFLRSE